MNFKNLRIIVIFLSFPLHASFFSPKPTFPESLHKIAEGSYKPKSASEVKSLEKKFQQGLEMYQKKLDDEVGTSRADDPHSIKRLEQLYNIYKEQFTLPSKPGEMEMLKEEELPAAHKIAIEYAEIGALLDIASMLEHPEAQKLLEVQKPKILRSDYEFWAPETTQEAKKMQTDYNDGLKKYQSELKKIFGGYARDYSASADSVKLGNLISTREAALNKVQQKLQEKMLSAKEIKDLQAQEKNLKQELDELTRLQVTAMILEKPDIQKLLSAKEPSFGITSMFRKAPAPVQKFVITKAIEKYEAPDLQQIINSYIESINKLAKKGDTYNWPKIGLYNEVKNDLSQLDNPQSEYNQLITALKQLDNLWLKEDADGWKADVTREMLNWRADVYYFLSELLTQLQKDFPDSAKKIKKHSSTLDTLRSYPDLVKLAKIYKSEKSEVEKK